MDKNKKESLIKIFILLIIQAFITIGIFNYIKVGGSPPTEGWRAKAGAIFFIAVTLILLIKEIKKILR
jgi:hypothetical protein